MTLYALCPHLRLGFAYNLQIARDTQTNPLVATNWQLTLGFFYISSGRIAAKESSDKMREILSVAQHPKDDDVMGLIGSA